MKRVSKSHFVMLVIGLALGAIALGAAQAAISVTSEVRIGVKRLEDGRVEVKLQQLGDEQVWSDLDSAPARYLPLDADVDQWRYSSAIEVVGAAQEEPEAVVERQPPVMCIHGHAYPQDDRFWRWTLAAADVAGYQYGVEMVLYGANDSAEHAADILDCISRDPITIATSLPYADDLRDALAEAQAAGAQVVTFNSGAGDADSVGSLMHIGLDDRAGGVRAGDEFDSAGVSGTLLCVIHEQDNVGLDDRCDGLEDGYDGGSVERMNVDRSANPDAAAEHGELSQSEYIQMLIAERVATGEIGGILTLNHDSAVAALATIEASGASVALASFGFSDELADAVRDGKMLFVVWDHPVMQGYLAVSAMAMAYTLELNQLNADVFFNGAEILIEPTLADKERAGELKSLFAGPPPSVPDDNGDDSSGSE